MSNTTTESEFDKEFQMLYDMAKSIEFDGWISAIKQAVDKQVDQLQTYKFTDGSEDKMVMLDDVKALYGGDKK